MTARHGFVTSLASEHDPVIKLLVIFARTRKAYFVKLGALLVTLPISRVRVNTLLVVLAPAQCTVLYPARCIGTRIRCSRPFSFLSRNIYAISSSMSFYMREALDEGLGFILVLMVFIDDRCIIFYFSTFYQYFLSCCNK